MLILHYYIRVILREWNKKKIFFKNVCSKLITEVTVTNVYLNVNNKTFYLMIIFIQNHCVNGNDFSVKYP